MLDLKVSGDVGNGRRTIFAIKSSMLRNLPEKKLILKKINPNLKFNHKYGPNLKLTTED